MPTVHDESGSTLDTTTGINGVASGGTGANLSATGGTGHVVQQASVGAAFTTGQITDAMLSAVVGVAKGGTGANMSATGGTGHFVKQASTGAAFTTTTLATSDITDAPYAIVGTGGNLQTAVTNLSSTGGTIYITATSLDLTSALTFAAASKPIILRGIPNQYSSGGTTIRATASLSQLVLIQSGRHRFYDIIFDGNQLATNVVKFDGATSVEFHYCQVRYAIGDGMYVEATGNPLNQGIVLWKTNVINNGRINYTAALAGEYTSTSLAAQRNVITGTATLVSANATINIAAGTDLTTLNIRAGCPVRVESNPVFYGVISSVTATAITLYGGGANLPTAAQAGAGYDYAIGVGSGWFEERSGNNGYCEFLGKSIFRSNGAFGIEQNALYGNIARGVLADFNCFGGALVGVPDNASVVSQAEFDQVYMEVNSGPDYWLGCAEALKITLPTEDGNDQMVWGVSNSSDNIGLSGTIERDGELESIMRGRRQNFCVEVWNDGGTIKHKIVADHWGAGTSNTASKITGASATFAATPNVAAGVDFTNGVGILNSDKTVLLLNTATEQASAIDAQVMVEFNSTGTDYYASIAPSSANVNGVTKRRYGLVITTSAGTAKDWTTLAAGNVVTVRFNGSLR